MPPAPPPSRVLMPPPSLPVGTCVFGKVYGDNAWYSGRVAEHGEDGRMRVDFNDGDIKWYSEKAIPKTLRTTCHGQQLRQRHPYHFEEGRLGKSSFRQQPEVVRKQLAWAAYEQSVHQAAQ